MARAPGADAPHQQLGHRPDFVALTDDGPIAIEVELVPKSKQRLDTIKAETVEAFDRARADTDATAA